MFLDIGVKKNQLCVVIVTVLHFVFVLERKRGYKLKSLSSCEVVVNILNLDGK